jgi:hypothetical protein
MLQSIAVADVLYLCSSMIRPLITLALGIIFSWCCTIPVCAETNGVASTPAMGWSTWSFVRRSPTESTVEAQALAMHNSGLQDHGFVYINLDDFYYLNPAQTVDAYGRWVVDTNIFPDGMAAVAAYVHGLGLKFGIYVTPGIPVAAYSQNTPIQGTAYHAQDIVTSTNSNEVNYNFGNNCMYFIDYSKPGAQAFINSWANLFASWGVDYVKIDAVGDGDIPDVAAWSQALVQTGRPIHLELSNSLDVNNGSTWRQYANGWRIEGDVECYCSGSSYPLTSWGNVSHRFSDAPKWTRFAGPGGWNDLDSLEIGNGANDGLNPVQRQATMTLWSICCAPLILGTDLTSLDTNDLPLLFNDRVLQIDQAGSVGAPLTYNTTTQVWRAVEPDGSYAVAFFNLGSSSANVSVTWSQLGFTNAAEVQDLWSGSDLGGQAAGYGANVASDGATLYRIAPLFPASRYLAAAPGNTIAGGAQVVSSTELSSGLKVGNLGNGATLTFNNNMAPTAGAYTVTLLYENGDASSRSANISINGGPVTAVVFSPGGSWTTLASTTITASLQAGTNNILISNPTGAAPDIDSLVVQNTVLVAPSAPSSPAVVGGNSQATLSWLASCGATGYRVKYGTNSGTYTTTTISATASLTVTGLTNGVVYYFSVTATNTAGESANSSEVSALVGPPAVPTGLSATGGNEQVSLQWNPSLGATSYNLERSTTNGGPYQIIATLAGTAFTDTSVTLETTYYYVVSAVNGAGGSATSAQASATPVILNGTYKIINQTSGLALDDPNGGGMGTGTDQQPYTGTNQQWTIVSVGGGDYKILAANGLALSGPTNNAQLVLTSYAAAANQLWSFQENGSWLILQNVGTGQVMDNFGLKTNAGNTIGQWSPNGGGNQNWMLTVVQLAVTPPPAFNAASRLPDGNVRLTFTGTAGQSYTVRSTTNMGSTPTILWVPLGTGTFGPGPVNFDDLTATNYPQRFYLITVP